MSFSKVIKHILGPAGKDAHSQLASLDSIQVSEPVLDALEQVVASRDTDWLAAEPPGTLRISAEFPG